MSFNTHDADPKQSNGMGPMVSRRSILAAGGALALGTMIGNSGLALAQGKAAMPLKLAMANNVMTVVYPYVTNAQAFGYFKDEGVDLQLMMGQGTPQVLSLLVAGTAELVFCNPEPMVRLVADRGMKMKSIFAAQQSQYILAVPEDSKITSVKELKGKRIGMFSPESGIDYLKARLMDDGLSVTDIQIVPTGFGGQVVAAVRQQQVDAILYWADALVLMGQAGLKLRRLPSASWENGLYQYVAVAMQETIDKRPDVLTAAVKAMVKGLMTSYIAPAATVEAFWKIYPDQAPKPADRDRVFQTTLERLQTYNGNIGLPLNAPKEQVMTHMWGGQTLSAWTRTQDALKRIGSISKEVDPATLFDNTFLDAGNKLDREKLYQALVKN